MDDSNEPLVRWRDLAEAIPGGVGIQSGEAFAYVTEDLATTVGIGTNTLVGDHWSCLFDRAETTRLERAIERVREDGRWRGNSRTGGRCADETPIELTVSKLEGETLLWQFEARERKPDGGIGQRIEHRSRPPTRSERVLNALDVDNSAYAIDEEGDAFVWTETFVETLGYSHEDLTTMDPMELVPEAQRDDVSELIEAIEGGVDRRVDVDVLTTDGERILHRFEVETFDDPDTGEPFRCGVARDISDRRKRERDLERYETIVETVDSGIYALDEDRRFSFVNDWICEMMGKKREELLGTPVTALFEDETERDAANEEVERILASETETGTIEATITPGERERVLETQFRLHPEPDEGGEFHGSVGVISDVTEFRRLKRELREERRFLENIVDALDDVLYVVDGAGTFAFWNDELCDRFGYDDDEVSGLEPRTFLTPAESDELPNDPANIVDVPDRHNVVDLVRNDDERIPHELRGVTYTDEETGERYRVGIARDITDRLERERELERQRDELATLDRINGLVLETARELIQTANREAVEETVCERLTESDRYEFAWVGEQEFDGDRISPRVTAGQGRAYLDDVTVTVSETDSGLCPTGRAVRDGRVQAVNSGDGSVEPWQEAASERGFESVAAVPLRHGETVYGVLTVYGTHENAFNEREQSGLDVLGRTVGLVIHASRSRDLLFADAVAELEFDVSGTDSALVRIATDLDCELTLDGYVNAGERWILYLVVDDAVPGDVVAAAAEDSRVDRARVVSGNDSDGRIECVLAESSLLHTVTDAGATVKAASATSRSGRLIVEAPADGDVRSVVDHVTGAYPGAELRARHDRDRAVTTVGRPGGVLDDLTGRQREALEAAYRAGYFRWPRESTAEEVAATLDLSAPTLHGHLRKAEAAILSRLLDAEPSDT